MGMLTCTKKQKSREGNARLNECGVFLLRVFYFSTLPTKFNIDNALV